MKFSKIRKKKNFSNKIYEQPIYDENIKKLTCSAGEDGFPRLYDPVANVEVTSGDYNNGNWCLEGEEMFKFFEIAMKYNSQM